jgi:hypothetical protein
MLQRLPSNEKIETQSRRLSGVACAWRRSGGSPSPSWPHPPPARASAPMGGSVLIRTEPRRLARARVRPDGGAMPPPPHPAPAFRPAPAALTRLLHPYGLGVSLSVSRLDGGDLSGQEINVVDLVVALIDRSGEDPEALARAVQETVGPGGPPGGDGSSREGT